MDISELVKEKMKANQVIALSEPVEKPQPVEKSSNFWLWLIICFIGLSYGAMFYFANKTDQQIIVNNNPVEKNIIEKPIQTPISKNLDSDIAYLKKAVEELQHRQYLLGIITNQNSAAVEKAELESLVQLTRDWLLNKFPNLIEFSEEGRKDIEKNIQR